MDFNSVVSNQYIIYEWPTYWPSIVRHPKRMEIHRSFIFFTWLGVLVAYLLLISMYYGNLEESIMMLVLGFLVSAAKR